MKYLGLGCAAVFTLLLVACSEENAQSSADSEFQMDLQRQLLDAQPGDVIEIPAGTYSFETSLSLAVDGVTIRGAGMDKSILSFKNQVAGAEGFLVTASDFTIEDLAIEDAKGDALKINEGKNIVIRRVRAEWTNGPDTANGAYGLYPVQTENVLIEGSVAIGASDAGIYVGQSRNVVVRNNRAEFNVAGIEIENTVGADVYGNVATNNTGGILVFNMPDLKQEGHSTRIYDNKIFANNTDNFAPEGGAVAGVPAGSGVLIQANDRVEIFSNEIKDNQTANIIISSYFSSGYVGKYEESESFDPYPETIFIYDNTFSGGGNAPDSFELKALKMVKFGIGQSLPDILWDGFANPAKSEFGRLMGEHAICVQNAGAQVLNVDGPNNNESVTTDPVAYECTHEKLPAIVLPEMLFEL